MSSRGAGGQAGNNMVCDMDEHGDMRADAQKVASEALESHDTEVEISRFVKSFFDKKYGPTWHCIVGTDFRAFVTHESKTFIFFYAGKHAVCLYRQG